MTSIRASIIGASGYTGAELIRLALAHPHVTLVHLTARQHDNAPIEAVFPHLASTGLRITNTDPTTVAAQSDVVFLALPHKTAQDTVAALHGKTKLIDLSADFRLKDPALYEQFYGLPHAHPHLLKDIPYGWPEVYGRDIAKAQTVANPGCFALLSQIMLYPFAGHIARADIMAVTGSSGAGKTPGDGTHHPVRNHNMKSYNINAHRHIPEICASAKIAMDQLNFTPTSGPFTRGIFATAFITLKNSVDASSALNVYKDKPFIRTTENVALANVVGSNFCDISLYPSHSNSVIVQGALDNLVKGAAGCAIQNMNLMFGLPETTGLLNLTPLYP